MLLARLLLAAGLAGVCRAAFLAGYSLDEHGLALMPDLTHPEWVLLQDFQDEQLYRPFEVPSKVVVGSDKAVPGRQTVGCLLHSVFALVRLPSTNGVNAEQDALAARLEQSPSMAESFWNRAFQIDFRKHVAEQFHHSQG